MSKKGKKKSSRKKHITNILLATAIINLLVSIIDLIIKLI